MAFTVFWVYMFAMAGLAVRGFVINQRTKKNAGAAAKAQATLASSCGANARSLSAAQW